MNLNRNGTDLCQKIRDNDRLTRAGHSEQDAVLRYMLRTGVFLTASVSPDEKSLTLVLVPFIVADVLKKVIPHWIFLLFRHA